MQSEDALLALTWLEQAKLRTEGDGEVCAGLDVAGPGEDETVLCVRSGSRIIHVRAWAGRDPRGDVLEALLPFKSQLKIVNVDTVGIGYYMAQHLRDHGLPVTEINAGQAARDTEKYLNCKAELYWGFRLRAVSGDLAGLTDEKTIAQLAGIRYSHNSRGQIVIESKDDARKRGVKSPDRAEAVILAFAEHNLVLGWVEYLRQEQQKIDERTGTARSAALKPVCPRCESTAVARICEEWKCNQCGHQFGRAAQIHFSPSRREVLETRDSLGLFRGSWNRRNGF